MILWQYIPTIWQLSFPIFHLQANSFKQEFLKTGGGEVAEKFKLTYQELLALEYLGEEVVAGNIIQPPPPHFPKKIFWK